MIDAKKTIKDKLIEDLNFRWQFEKDQPGITWEKLMLEVFKDHKNFIKNYDLLEELEQKKS
jgi:hypothetical protein